MTLEDTIKLKLYDEFYKDNVELFDKKPIEYWYKCRRFIEREYHKRLEDYSIP